MLTCEEWRAHARTTRSAAARATRFGAHEFARTLLQLADTMDRQADLAVAAPPPKPAPPPCRLPPVRCCGGPLFMPIPANDRPPLVEIEWTEPPPPGPDP